MTKDTINEGCPMRCWATAGAIGVFVFAIKLGLAHQGFVTALFLGGLTALLLGPIFTWLFCAPVPRTGQRRLVSEVEEAARAEAPAVAGAAAASAAATQAKTDRAAGAAELAEVNDASDPARDQAAGVKAAAPRAPESRTGDHTAASPDDAEGAPSSAPASAPKASPEAEHNDASDPVRDQAAAHKAAEPGLSESRSGDHTAASPDDAERPDSAGTKPAMLAEARDGGADNLKEIKGIGPALEKLCHELGIYHFDQIAGWGAAEVAWMDANLKGFRGRVSRDDWVGQAKTLATGGATEFSRKVEEGKVY